MTQTLIKSKLLLSILFTFYIKIVAAQYNFTQISKEQGLPHNSIECILQSKTGFMWFGTRDGLCRYDGYEIKVYRNTSDPNSISGNRILSLAEDQQGFIWVGTYQNGANKFDPKTNQFIHYGNENKIGDQVNRIKVLKDGTVCLASNKGLALFNPQQEKFRIFIPNSSPYGINSYVVSDILEATDGNIYIATWENDLQCFNKKTKKFESITYIEGSAIVNYRKRLLEDSEGNLWISALKHGVCRYNRKTGAVKFFHKGNKELSTDVLTGEMAIAPDGKIWIATDGGGINILNPDTETFEYIYAGNSKNDLPGNQIYTLRTDQAGRIWVGTFDKGVACYDPFLNKFSNKLLPLQIRSFFKGKSVLCILQDTKENIWIGTDGDGLHRIDNYKQIKHFYFDSKNSKSISGNVITSLEEDKDGNILIGTYNNGLSIYKYKANSFERYQQELQNEQSLHSENVWTILSDSEGTNWLGLLGNGADIFNSQTKNFRNIGPHSNEAIKIGHLNVMCIMEDADGDIWFGTEGGGIYVYDKQAKKVLRIAMKNKLSSKGIIKALFQDNWGNIWIGSEGNGLWKYNKQEKKSEHFTIDQGLPSMIIMGILEDDAEGIWVSTYDGLALLKKNAHKFISFNHSDGLASNEFNPEAFIRLKNGTFLAGSVSGIDLFHPNQSNLKNYHFKSFSHSQCRKKNFTIPE